MNNITFDEAQGINRLSPGNDFYKVGDALRISFDKRDCRRQDYIRYVDGAKSVSGDGKSWDNAFATITEGITALNGLSGKGATLLIAPGFYIENAANVPVLSASDCLIKAVGLPEDTVWFGSGADGSVSAATDDLLEILGGNNAVVGLSLYVHKNTKSALVFRDTGGGYAGSFNLIQGCYFTPQAQDGEAYCIKYEGGNANWIRDCHFYCAATAAILLTGNTGNPVRNEIVGNRFVGTAIGVHITSANYNTLIKDNWFSAGSQSGEAMTNGIVISAGMNAGKVSVVHNYFEQSAANDIADSKTGGTLIEMDNSNGA